jgi:hypothetical protein
MDDDLLLSQKTAFRFYRTLNDDDFVMLSRRLQIFNFTRMRLYGFFVCFSNESDALFPFWQTSFVASR